MIKQDIRLRNNRLTETANGVLNNYYYAANNNRLSNIAQGSVSQRIFTYDAAGNVTQDLRNSTNAYNYTINNAGRIRTLSLGAALRTTYTYDGMQKLRVKAQTTPVSTTHYVWDNFGHIIAEHASAGGVQKEYIWLGDTPLAVFEGANLFYVHPDNLDRPVMMTNNNIGQTIAWQAKYDPFGNPVTVTSAITNNQRLPGQYFQIEDGLAYNWHRTYDASLGRYTQADPLGFVDGPSVYGYAGQSPVMRVDPSGLHSSNPSPQMPEIPFWLDPRFHYELLKMCLNPQLLMSERPDEPQPIPCNEQWDFAYQVCEDQIANKKRGPYNTGGHTDIHKCAKGLVSQSCGGTKVH